MLCFYLLGGFDKYKLYRRQNRKCLQFDLEGNLKLATRVSSSSVVGPAYVVFFVYVPLFEYTGPVIKVFVVMLLKFGSIYRPSQIIINS